MSNPLTSGDFPLVERLMDNLLVNAIRYNKPGGRVEIITGTDGLAALLVVINTGPVIEQQDIDRLFEPFQRHGPQRTGDYDGLGLGLPIISAIATAHHATVVARAQPSGGLRVETRFPIAAAPDEPTPVPMSTVR